MDEQKCETLAVAICDDEPEILKQLQRLAQSALDGTPAVFYAAGQPQSLLMEKRSFDIAILDIRFPGFSGIELAKWLLGRNPLCQILFVSSFPTYVSDVYDVPHLVMILKDQIQAQLPKYLRRAVQNLWASGSVKLVSADTVRVYAAAQIVCLERNGRVTRVTMFFSLENSARISPAAVGAHEPFSTRAIVRFCRLWFTMSCTRFSMQQEAESGSYVVCGGDFNKDLLGDSSRYFGVSTAGYTWAQSLRFDLFDGTGLTVAAPLDPDNPVPSCRNADAPYHEGQLVLTVDGFVVSANVTVESAAVLDEGFRCSDHNPVELTFTLNDQ